MRGFVDTIFSPILNFLNGIFNNLTSARLSVPRGKLFDVFDYFNYLGMFGPAWRNFVVTVAFLSFIYLILYLILNNIGFFIKVKDAIKWW